MNPMKRKEIIDQIVAIDKRGYFGERDETTLRAKLRALDPEALEQWHEDIVSGREARGMANAISAH